MHTVLAGPTTYCKAKLFIIWICKYLTVCITKGRGDDRVEQNIQTLFKVLLESSYLWILEDVLADGLQVSDVGDAADIVGHGLDYNITGRKHELMGTHLWKRDCPERSQNLYNPSMHKREG